MTEARRKYTWAVKHAFPEVLSEEKQYKKLSNLLQKMKKAEFIGVQGSTVHAEWFLINKE